MEAQDITHPMGLNQKVPEQIQTQLADWMKRNAAVKLPIPMPDLRKSYEEYLKQAKLEDKDKALYSQIKRTNLKAIRQEFIIMMQVIFLEIQPELKECFKRGSLVYIYDLIEKNLNKDVFPAKFHLPRGQGEQQGKTPNGNSVLTPQGTNPTPKPTEKEELGVSKLHNERVFAQLFEIMYQLIAEYDRHYKIDREDNLEEAAFEAFIQYAEQNPNSTLVKRDQKQAQNEAKPDFSMADTLYDLLGYKNEKGSQSQEVKKQKMSTVGTLFDKLLRVKDKQAVQHYKQKITQNAYSYAGAIYNYANSLYWGGKKEQQDDEPPKQLTKSTLKLIQDRISNNDPKRCINEEQMNVLVTMAVESSSKQIASNIKPDYKDAMIDAVTEQLEKDPCSYPQMKSKVVKELMIGLDLTNQEMERSRLRMQKINQSPEGSMDLQGKPMEDFEQWSKIMILLYRAVEKDYDPYRRRLLKNIFRHFCKVNRMHIESFSALRTLESICFNQQEKETQTLRLMREDISERRTMSITSQQKGETTEVQMAFEHQINRIFLYEFKKKYEPQRLELVRLSKPGVHNRVINLTVSGFLSEDTDKIRQWRQLVSQMPDSQVYSVCWSSKTAYQIFEYALEGAKDLVFRDVGILGHIGGPYVRAAAMMRTLYQKYNENPFEPAFETARLTGYYLAEMIISTFKGHFVNLLAFSLGTEVVRCCLERLAERNHLNMVHKIVTMGGVADKKQFLKFFQNCKYPIDAINLYSMNDSVLRYLFKVARPYSEPLGLNEMIKSPPKGSEKDNEANPEAQSHTIRNIDCTDFINGHTNFREKMKLIGRVIDAKEQ